MDSVYPPPSLLGTREDIRDSARPNSLQIAEDGYGLIYTDSTGTQHPVGPAYVATEPATADFPTQHGIHATLDDSHGGILLSHGVASVTRYQGFFRTVGALASGQVYTADTLLLPAFPPSDNANCSIAVANAGGSEYLTVGPVADYDYVLGKVLLEVCHVTESGGVWSRTRIGGFHWGAFLPVWLRVTIDDDGNAAFYAGATPYYWSQFDVSPSPIPSPLIGFGYYGQIGFDFEPRVALLSFSTTVG